VILIDVKEVLLKGGVVNMQILGINLKQKGRKDSKHVPFSIDVKGGEKSCEKLVADVRGSNK